MGTRNRREPGKAFLRGNRIQLGMPTFSLFNLIFTYPFRKFFVTERWVLNPGREKNSVGVFFFFLNPWSLRSIYRNTGFYLALDSDSHGYKKIDIVLKYFRHLCNSIAVH